MLTLRLRSPFGFAQGDPEPAEWVRVMVRETEP